MSPSVPRFPGGRRCARRRIDGGAVDQHRAGARDHHPRPLRPPICSTSCSAHNDTLEHQHLALGEIHRLTGHDQLFDTLFVYENYPVDTAGFSGAQELAVTEFSSREYNHYPLTVEATRVANWVFASSTTPTCSTRPASRR